MKVKYKGDYEGVVPWCGLKFVPGEEKEVRDEVGEQLLLTGQFEVVKETIKEEIPKTTSTTEDEEVNERGKTSSTS